MPYEGGYRQIEVVVAGQAMITFEPLPNMIAAGLRPAPDYLRYYLEGMAEHGFSEIYVQQLCAQIAEMT